MYIITFNKESIKELRDLARRLSIKLNIQGNIDFADYEHLIGPLTKIDKVVLPDNLPDDLNNIWQLRASKYAIIYNHLEDIVLLSGVIGIGSDEIFKILYANYPDVQDLFYTKTGFKNIEQVPDVYGNTITSCISYVKKNCLLEVAIRKKAYQGKLEKQDLLKYLSDDYQKILQERFILNDSDIKLRNLMKNYHNYKYNADNFSIDDLENNEKIKIDEEESNPLEKFEKINQNLYTALKDLEDYIIDDGDIIDYINKLKKEVSDKLANGESVSNLQYKWEEINKAEENKNHIDILKTNLASEFINRRYFRVVYE